MKTIIFILIFTAFIPAWSKDTLLQNLSIESDCMSCLPSLHHEDSAIAGALKNRFLSQWISKGVPLNALKKALTYFRSEAGKFLENKRYLTILDYTKPSNEERLYLLDLESGGMFKSLVAHGRNSGVLFAEDTSRGNHMNSNQTAEGFMQISEQYMGKYGKAYRMDGLEPRNSNIRDRAVVMHQAAYATPNFVKQTGRLGRSFGCPAVPPESMRFLLEKKLEGSLVYSYTVADAE